MIFRGKSPIHDENIPPTKCARYVFFKCRRRQLGGQDQVPVAELGKPLAVSDVAPLAGRRCLVLDDDFLIAFDVQQVLEAAGAANVTCVSNSDDALTAIRVGPKFDFAVLDVKLGGATPATSQNSLSVAAALTGQETPFVFLTGMLGDEAWTKQFPHVPVVEKPYQTKLLLAALARALAGR
jgi:CheY-like chemotaxis protein